LEIAMANVAPTPRTEQSTVDEMNQIAAHMKQQIQSYEQQLDGLDSKLQQTHLSLDNRDIIQRYGGFVEEKLRNSALKMEPESARDKIRKEAGTGIQDFYDDLVMETLESLVKERITIAARLEGYQLALLAAVDELDMPKVARSIKRTTMDTMKKKAAGKSAQI
jgi:hypothetical protein